MPLHLKKIGKAYLRPPYTNKGELMNESKLEQWWAVDLALSQYFIRKGHKNEGFESVGWVAYTTGKEKRDYSEETAPISRKDGKSLWIRRIEPMNRIYWRGKRRAYE